MRSLEIRDREIDVLLVGPRRLAIGRRIDQREHGGAHVEVVAVEYFGHDQMVLARLSSGALLKIRLPAGVQLTTGQRVGAIVKGDVFAFPAQS